MRDPTKLRAFELADQLAICVYQATSSFPRAEMFGLNPAPFPLEQPHLSGHAPATRKSKCLSIIPGGKATAAFAVLKPHALPAEGTLSIAVFAVPSAVRATGTIEAKRNDTCGWTVSRTTHSSELLNRMVEEKVTEQDALNEGRAIAQKPRFERLSPPHHPLMASETRTEPWMQTSPGDGYLRKPPQARAIKPASAPNSGLTDSPLIHPMQSMMSRRFCLAFRPIAGRPPNCTP